MQRCGDIERRLDLGQGRRIIADHDIEAGEVVAIMRLAGAVASLRLELDGLLKGIDRVLIASLLEGGEALRAQLLR